MEKGDALKRIKQMTIAEKIARLSESDIAHIQGCIEQTISDEEKQTIEIKRRNIEK